MDMQSAIEVDLILAYLSKHFVDLLQDYSSPFNSITLCFNLLKNSSLFIVETLSTPQFISSEIILYLEH